MSASLGNDFVLWDDPAYITENKFIQSFSFENLQRFALELHMGNWHPLTWFSHAVDVAVFGLNPMGHHLTNLLLHGLNAILVFIVFQLLWRSAKGEDLSLSETLACFSASLLFAIHPLRVESVVWASERKDVLCALFSLLCYGLYLSYAQEENRRARQQYYWASWGCLALALMSKPMAATAPLVLLLWDVYPLNRWNRVDARRLIVEKIPFIALIAGATVLALVAQKGAGAMLSVERLGWDERIMNAVHSGFFYLQKTLVPLGLSALYPFAEERVFWSAWFLGPALFFILLVGGGVWLWRGTLRSPALLAVVLYYAITLAPVAGVIQVGTQAAADRYTYLPTLGFYLLAAWLAWRGIESISEKHRRWVCLLALVTLYTVLAALTHRQTLVWADTASLWQNTARLYPDNLGRVHFTLAKIHDDAGRWREAEQGFLNAIRIDPKDIPARNRLGLLYSKLKRWEEAEAAFRSVLAIRVDAKTLNNLGLLYLQKGDFQAAEDRYKEALQAEPGMMEARANLGYLYMKQGKLDSAEEQLRLALQADPENAGIQRLWKLLQIDKADPLPNP